jgi:hypothetical protein
MRIDFEFVPIPHALFEDSKWASLSDAELRMYLYFAHVCNRLGVDAVVLTDSEILRGRFSLAGHKLDRGAGVRSRTTLNTIRSRGSDLFQVLPAGGGKGFKYRPRSFGGQNPKVHVQQLDTAAQPMNEQRPPTEQATIRKEELEEQRRICIRVEGTRCCSDGCSGWTCVSDHLRAQLGEHKWEIWIKPLKANGCREGGLHLTCPEQLMSGVEWYLPVIKKSVAEVAGCGGITILSREVC